MSPKDYITRYKHILTLFVLTIAVFLLFGETISHGFNSDDYLAVYHALLQPTTSVFEGISEFTRPSWGLYYRPGIKLFLEALARLFTTQPAGYHAMSLICYAVLCFEAYLIGFLLSNRWYIAFTSAVIFLSLGVHGEAIFWISSLNGVVENILTLASLICFVMWRRREKRVYVVLSLLLFIAALLTKESAISLPILLMCYSFLLGGEVNPTASMRRTLRECWPFLLVGVFFVVLRSVVMSQADLPQSLTHFGWQSLVVGPWHAFLMTLSPIDWAMPVHVFGKGASLGLFFYIIAAIGLLVIALVPLSLKKYRATFLLWWIPAAVSPIFALGLVPSERHLIISSVGAAVFLSLALFKMSAWLTQGAKPSSIVIGCVIVMAFSISGLHFLKQRGNAWKHASDIANGIVKDTMTIHPVPKDITTFFFLNVPDAVDGAFVFRFKNLEYALRLFYGNDSINVVRIVSPDRIPSGALANRNGAYFKIGAMGGYIYLPDNFLESPRVNDQWERMKRLEVLRQDFRFERDWERYADSPFLVYTENGLVRTSSDELRKVFRELYSLL
jgi:hypothetical protein